MKILFFAALPRELRVALRTFAHVKPLRDFPFRAFSCRHPSHRITVVETGVGTKSAGRVFNHVLSKISADLIVSLGYGGALNEETSIGDLLWASRVGLIADSTIKERDVPDPLDLFSKISLLVPIRQGTVFTMEKWMKKAEIVHLMPHQVGFSVCDMETFTLADPSIRDDVPFFSIRSVSDRLETELRFHPHAVCDPSGMFSLPRAVRLFLVKPHLLGHAAQLLRNSNTASRSLAGAITSLLRIL